MLKQIDLERNPYLGIFCASNEANAFVCQNAPKKFIDAVREALGADVIQTNIGGGSTIGALLALNSYGIVVSNLVTDAELKKLRRSGLTVAVLPEVLNAIGNNVLANDYGALVHPDFDKKSIDIISKTLNVPVTKGTIAGMKTIGSVAVATKKGVLAHPKTSDENLKKLEKIFNVPASIGTVNHSNPMIGACMIANTKGAVMGSLTTGPELGRIEEALGFLE